MVGSNASYCRNKRTSHDEKAQIRGCRGGGVDEVRGFGVPKTICIQLGYPESFDAVVDWPRVSKVCFISLIC